MEQQPLPIDVNYQKLAEWLVQRQKLPSDWHKMVHAIQAKMSEAVKQLPADLLSTLDLGKDTALDYFSAQEVFKALDSQEGSRNMLGGRTGSASVWEKVVKAYEKSFLFVGEASQTMIQNTDHEIPYLRKQATRYDQLVSDGEKKQAELLKAASTCASAYKEECSKLGIEGAHVRSELQQLVQQLPGMFLEVVEKLQEPALQQALNYYQQFAAFAHELPEGQSESTVTTLKQVMQAQAVDAKLVLERAKSSRAAAKPGQSDSAEVAEPVSIDWGIDLGAATQETAGPNEANAAGIDWDVALDTTTAGAADIDWDVTADSVTEDANATVDIKWDVDVSAAGDEGTAPSVGIDWEVVTGDEGTGATVGDINWDIDIAAEGADKAAEINWDLDVGEAGEAAGLEVDWDIGEEQKEGELQEPDREGEPGACKSSSSSPSTTSDVVERLQHDGEYRAGLLDDVQEMCAFLAMRKAELQSSGADMFLALLPEALQHIDKERVSNMSSAAEAAKNLMLSGRLRQLLLIMTSPQYLDRLVRTLELKAGQEARLIQSHKEVEARRNESILALKELQPKIQKLVTKTKNIKAAVEQALANQFAGRRINVLGEINVVLAQSC